jgi:hypothetical protein
MHMIKRVFIALLAVAAMTLLTACDQPGSGGTSTQQHKLLDFDRKASFFDGAAVATYMQTRDSYTNDYISIVFYEPGNYLVMFSTPPSIHSNGGGDMPVNFRKEIAAGAGPREVVVRQYRIPNYVRITIVRTDGTDESHDMD